MSAERREHLLTLLADHNDTVEVVRRICALCVAEVAVSGARVRVLGGLGAQDGGAMVHATDELSVRLDDLQQTVGEGPCVDAFAMGRPVLIPDLALVRARWPGFAATAAAAGVAAVFSFPLQIGAVRLGVLELHRRTPGWLTQTQLVDAFLLADAATNAILDDLDGVVPLTLPGLVDIQATVHQATGFVAVDLEVSLQEALLRIRGYAFTHRMTLTEVASGIIERRLRLDSGK